MSDDNFYFINGFLGKSWLDKFKFLIFGELKSKEELVDVIFEVECSEIIDL